MAFANTGTHAHLAMTDRKVRRPIKVGKAAKVEVEVVKVEAESALTALIQGEVNLLLEPRSSLQQN